MGAKRTQKLVLAALVAALHFSCGGPAPTTETAPSHPTFRVGFCVLDFPYEKHGKPDTLTVAVWYPTAAPAEEHTYPGGIRGFVAVNAPPLQQAGPYPLFVFSHGFGGSGLSAVYLTEHLAARGWIVAAPDHHDPVSVARIRTGPNPAFDRKKFREIVRQIVASSPRDRDRYLYRLCELKATIDGLLGTSDFAPLIDTSKIAVGGHSFGGFTALGLCGPLPEFHDRRIRALVLLSSGAAEYLFTDEELRAVRAPTLLVFGRRERHQRRGKHTVAELAEKLYQNLPPPKILLELKGAGHFSFSNALTPSWTSRFLSGTEEQFAVLRKYIFAFLDVHVLGRAQAASILARRDPLVTRLRQEPR